MKDTISTFLELRILVLTLGETGHAGWWKSKFMSPIGLSFLERLYPRSTFAAAVRSAGTQQRLTRANPIIERSLTKRVHLINQFAALARFIFNGLVSYYLAYCSLLS